MKEKLKNYLNGRKTVNYLKMKTNYLELYNWIFKKTKNFDSYKLNFTNRIEIIINDIKNAPKCQNPNCNNFVTEWTHKTCSKECRSILHSINRKEYYVNNMEDWKNSVKKFRVENKQAYKSQSKSAKIAWEKSYKKLNETKFKKLSLENIKKRILFLIKDKKSQAYTQIILKKDPNLYNNIDKFITLPNKKFTEKIYRILNFENNLINKERLCPVCENVIYFKDFNRNFGKLCSKCMFSLSLKYRFLLKYGYEDGLKKFNEDCEKRKGNLSLDWFIKKYGEKYGEVKYQENWEYNFSQRKKSKFK